MRVSTTQMYRQGVEAFDKQQVKISHLQQQISSGIKLTRPSDDPAGSSRALVLLQSISIRTQYQDNISLADNRLRLAESTLGSVKSVIIRLKEQAILANNAILDETSLYAIGVEMEERIKELLSIANTRDGNNDFLYAGYQNSSQPFVVTQTGAISHVVYNGDQGQRSLQISESRQVTVDNSGSEIFMDLTSATAVRESAATANTGTASIAPAQVFDTSEYIAGPYEVRFTAPGVYDVYDVTNAVNIVTGETYTSGAEISFQGVRTSISGTTAIGDVFTVEPSNTKSIFETVNLMADTLRGTVSNDQLTSNIAEFLTDLDIFQNRVFNVVTSIGGRHNALDSQKETNEATIEITNAMLTDIRSTDDIEAVSQLKLEQITLEAAQAVFERITRSTLFDLLR